MPQLFALKGLLVLGLLLAPSATRATSSLVFDNGLLNVIDTTVAVDFLTLRNGPGGTTTTARVVDGGSVIADTTDDTRVELLDRSHLELASGSTPGAIINARNTSRVTCSDCFIASNTFDAALHLSDQSTLEIDSGVIVGIDAVDQSRILISGGWVVTFGPGIRATGDTSVIVTAGEVTGAAIGASFVDISGGLFSDDSEERRLEIGATRMRISGGVFTEREARGGFFLGGGEVRISGGSFEVQDLYVRGQDLRISGGLFDVGFLRLDGLGTLSGGMLAEGLAMNIQTGAIITIIGFGFNLPDGPVVATSGVITGFLLDGSPLDVSFLRADAGATLILQSVPEPSSIALLFAAVAAGLARGRPHRLGCR
jgi:hypothetical protein